MIKKLAWAFILFVVLMVSSVPSFSNDEVEEDHELTCLTKVIYFEARGETQAGKMAVAWTALNRTKHPNFPDTVCKVIAQPFQFPWNAAKRKIIDSQLFEELKLLADQVRSYYNIGIVPKQIKHVERALYFNNEPFPVTNKYVKVGNHYFYTAFTARQPRNEIQ